MRSYKICVPHGTRERLMSIAIAHQLDIPIGQGGPNIYHFSRERLEKAIALLETLSHFPEIQTLTNELKYYDRQSRPPADRLFEDR